MTKQDLVEQLSAQNGFSRTEAIELVECVLDLVKDSLIAGESVKINGFGKWMVKDKDERRGRNPQTGEELTLDGRRVVTFKPSLLLKSKVNGDAADASLPT